MSFAHTYRANVNAARGACRTRLHEDESFFRFLLGSLTLPLETVLHRRLGGRYLTLMRAIVATALLWVSGSLFSKDFEMRSLKEVFQGKNDFGEVFTPQFGSDSKVSPWSWFLQTRLLPIQLRAEPRMRQHSPFEAFTNLRAFPVIVRVHNSHASLERQGREFVRFPTVLGAVGAFLTITSFHWVLNFFSARRGERRQSRYNGDSWAVWNPFYYIARRTHFSWDVAKMIAEPLLCIGLGLSIAISLKKWPEFGDAWIVFARWSFFGGFFLFFKAYLDDRPRISALTDVGDGEENMHSFEEAQPHPVRARIVREVG